MQRRTFFHLAAGAALAARGLLTRSTSTTAQQPGSPRVRIFGANSYSGDVLPVYEITDGETVPFATLNAGGWIGPLVASPDGRLLAVTNALGGSLWDITAGGDFTTSTPIASGLYEGHVSFLEGLAIDAAGTAYVANGETGLQPIAQVDTGGNVTYLAQQLENPRGLIVQSTTLYACEGSSGSVMAYDLTTGLASVFATGFVQQSSHTVGQFAVDPRGRLLVLWATGGASGLYDITAGGDFSSQPQLVAASFGIDVNQIAVDPTNAVYAAGDGDGICYVSRFQAGAFLPFAPFATGLGDTESVAVLVQG